MSDVIMYPSVKVKVNGEWQELVTKAKSDHYGVVKLTDSEDSENGIAVTPKYVEQAIPTFKGTSPLTVTKNDNEITVGMDSAAGVIMVDKPTPTSDIANNYKLYIQV